MTCKHLWLKLAGGMYRWKPTEICSLCGVSKPIDKPECEHLRAVHVWAHDWDTTESYVVNGVEVKEENGSNCDRVFDYCPKCGEKL